jgi:phospholipase C
LGWAVALSLGAAACSSANGSNPETIRDAAVGDGQAHPSVDAASDAHEVDGAAKLASIHTVFLFLFENHNWLGQIHGSPTAPYINSLLAMGAHAEQYYNPPLNHPSLPNYLWIESGDSLGVIDDNDPSFHVLATTDHLVDYLERANISWKAYEEDIDGQSCPMEESATYAPKHDPFVYFKDINGNVDSTAARCLAHVRPYSELAGDIASGSISRYNFITPNLCHDMHDCAVSAGDAWLQRNLPPILQSAPYKDGGAVFITWDEGEDGDGPVGMILLSPKAKVGYANALHYDHSSLLKTLQEVFGVAPLLRHAGDPNTLDLSDLFSDLE